MSALEQRPSAALEVEPGGPENLPPMPGVRLGSGTVWSVAMQITTALVNIVVGVMVSRALGPDGKGTLSIIQQTVAILLVFGDLGIGLAAIYYISKGEVRPGTVLGNALVALVAVGAAAALAMLVLFRSPVAVIQLDWTYFAAAFGLFLASLAMSWTGSIAVGVRGVRGLAVPSMISSVTGLALIAVAWTFGWHSALVVLLSSAAGVVVGVVLAAVSVAPWLGPVRASASTFRSMSRYSAKLYIASAADFLHFRQDILMLGWLAGVGAAGVYSVGVSIAEVATRLPSAMGSAIQAQASRVSHESALDLAARAIRLTALFALVVIGGLSLIVWWLIPALFGESFRGAVYVFYVLVPGALANALIWPISSYQSARGQVYWGVSFVSVGVNVLLNLVLIPRFGFLGAAASSSVSYAFLVLALVIRLTRDSGMSAGFFLLPKAEDARIVATSIRSYLRR